MLWIHCSEKSNLLNERIAEYDRRIEQIAKGVYPVPTPHRGEPRSIIR